MPHATGQLRHAVHRLHARRQRQLRAKVRCYESSKDVHQASNGSCVRQPRDHLKARPCNPMAAVLTLFRCDDCETTSLLHVVACCHLELRGPLYL